MPFRAMQAHAPGAPLKPVEIDPGPLGPEQVEIAVTHCGLCHSDLSMLNNAWGITSFPFVPGHEAVGTIVEAGPAVRGLSKGQTVGVGWYSGSCMACPQCIAGRHHFCRTGEGTIVGRPGGFAARVRCHWAWAIPVPKGLDPAAVGPMFCGGITVFDPIVHCGVKPTDRVGVVGIGGLGHIALRFLNKWGCEVTAFTSSAAKMEEARSLGAHHVVDSRSDAALEAIKGSLNFILVTVNVPLNWGAYLDALAPSGRLHVVGAVLEPMAIGAMPLIMGQKAVSGSPVGAPDTMRTMLDFAARHGVAPTIETFPMSRANEALAHLHAGKARYRIVLRNDLV